MIAASMCDAAELYSRLPELVEVAVLASEVLQVDLQ